jgi:hypothetical protein
MGPLRRAKLYNSTFPIIDDIHVKAGVPHDFGVLAHETRRRICPIKKTMSSYHR